MTSVNCNELLMPFRNGDKFPPLYHTCLSVLIHGSHFNYFGRLSVWRIGLRQCFMFSSVWGERRPEDTWTQASVSPWRTQWAQTATRRQTRTVLGECLLTCLLEQRKDLQSYFWMRESTAKLLCGTSSITLAVMRGELMFTSSQKDLNGSDLRQSQCTIRENI